MKRFLSMKLVALAAIFIVMCSGLSAQTYTYSQAFTNGVTPTTQCTAWTAYCASLPSSGLTGFTISSSISGTTYTCTNPCTAQSVANAMRTAVAGSYSSDGHTWYVGTGCGSGCGGSGAPVVELAVDQGACACGTTASIRPAINNLNWGGVGTTCTAPSQTLTLVFTSGGNSWYSNVGGGDASNLNNWWSNDNNTGSHPAGFTSSSDIWVFQSNMTCSASPFTLAGSVNIVSGGSFTPASASIFNVGGNWNNTGGSFIHNGGTVSFAAGSACVNTFTLSGAMSGTNKFNNLTFNTAGSTWSFGANACDVAGNFTISAGTVVAPSFPNTLQVGGAWSNSGTFTHNSGTVNMYGTGGTMSTNGSAFYNLNFTGTGGTWTLSSSLTASNNLTVSTGTFNTNNQTVTVSNNWSNSGIVNAGTSNITINGSYANNSGATFTAGTSTVLMSGSTTGLSLTGDMTAATNGKFYNLTFNGSGTFTFNNAADVANTFLQTAGTVIAPSGNLNVGGSAGGYNFEHTAGTFNPNGGTVTVNGGSSTLYANGMTTTTGTLNCFNNLTFNGTGGSSWYIQTTTSIAGNFSNLVTNSYVYPEGTLNVGGNWTNNGYVSNTTFGSTINMTGTTGGLTLSGNLTTGTNSAFYILNFTGVGGDYTFSGPNADVTNGININAGANVTAPSGTLNVGGGWTGNGTFNNNGGTVNFNGSSVTVSGSSLTGSNKFNNLTFSGCNTYSFSSNTDIGGNFLNSCGTVNLNANTYNIGGNYTNNSVLNQGTSTVNMNGATGSYTLSASGGSLTFYNLGFTGGANWSFAGGTTTLNANNNFVISSGTVTMPTGTTSIAGSYTNLGSMLNNNGTVTMTGSGTMNGNMTGANKFNNLTFSGAGYSFGANSADVGNNFTITSGTVTAPSTTLQIAGNYSNSGTFTNNNGTVGMNGTGAAITMGGVMTGTSSFYNLLYSGTGSWTINNSLNTNNNFTVNSGVGNVNTNGQAISIGNNMTNNGVLSASSSTITLNGSWTNNGTFNCGTSVVVFNGSLTTLTINGNLTAASNGAFNITNFSGSGTYTFNNSADIKFQLNELGGNIVAPSGNLNIGLNVTNLNYSFFQSGGNFNPNGGTVTFNNGTASITTGIGPNNMITTSGTLNCFNNVVLNGAAGTIFQTTGQITLLGNFTNNTATENFQPQVNMTVGGNWVNNGLFTNGGNTVTMNGSATGLVLSGNMTGSNKFGNLTFNGTGAWSFSSAADVNQNFTITNGTVTAPSTLLQVAGNIAFNGGSFNNNSGTVNMNGTSASVINGSSNFTGSNKFNNLTITNGAGSTTLSNNTDIGANLTITSGTLVAPAGTLQIAGNFANNGGAFTNNSGTVNFNGAGTLSASGSGTLTTTNKFNNINFDGVGPWTFNNNADINNNFTISSGTVTAPSILNIGGNYTNNGTFLNNLGTVNLGISNAGSFTLNGNMTGSNKFNNLTWGGVGGTNYTFNSSADIGGTFTLANNAGATLTGPSGNLTVYGNWNHSGSSNYVPNGGTVIMAGSGTMSGLMNNNVNPYSGWPQTAPFNNLTFTGGAYSILSGCSVQGSFTIASGAGPVTAPNTNPLAVAGNWTNNGTFTANSGNVWMNGTGSGYSISGNLTGTSSFNNLVFANGGAWTFLNNATCLGGFNITSGTVTAPSGTLTVGNSWNNSGSFLNNSGTVIMNATTGTISMAGNMTGANKFNNLTFNGVGGIWQFTSAADMGGNLTLTNGTVQGQFAGTINIFGNYSSAAGTSFTAPGTINESANWTNLGSFTANSGTVNMNGTGSNSISGSLTGATGRFYNLTFNNGGGSWTFGSPNAEVNNNFVITAGSVTAPSSTLTMSSATNAAVYQNNGGTFANNGGTVLMNGGSVTFSSSGTGTLSGSNKFNNITFTGGNTYSFSNNADFGGNFTNTSGTVNFNTNTYNVGGNWTNSSTFNAGSSSVYMNAPSGSWTIGTAISGANAFYNLYFDGGATWSFGANAAQVNNIFNIMSGTVNAPTTTLTMAGATGGSFTNTGDFINNNGTVIMNNTGTWTLNGNLTGANKFYNFTVNNTGTSTFNVAADIAGTFTESSGTVNAPNTLLQVAGNFTQTGGSFFPNNGTVNMNNTTATAMTLTTANMNTNGGTSFYNLSFSGLTGTSVWSWVANPVYVSGDFIINGGSVTAPSGQTISVGKSWTNNGIFVANTGTVNMTGLTAGNTLNGNMTVANNGAFYNLSFVTNNQTFSFTSNADITNVLTQSTGTVNAPAVMNIVTSGSSGFNQSAGTFVAPSSFLNDGGYFTHTAGTFTPNGGTVNMNGSFSETLTTTGMSTFGTNCFNNLTFTPAAAGLTYTFASTPLLVMGNFSNLNTIASGTVSAGANTITIGGSYTNLGVFSSGTSTIVMNGVTSGLGLNGIMTGGSQFYNLTCNGSGGVYTFNNTASVSNNMLISAGSEVVAPVTTLNLGVNYTNNGTFNAPFGSIVNFSYGVAGSLNGTMTGASAFYNLIFSGGSTYTFNAAANVTYNLTNTSGTVLENANTITVGNNFSNASTYTLTSGILNIGGSYSNTSLFNSGTSTVNMTGGVGPYTLGTIMTGTSAFYNLNFTGGGSWSFGANAATTNASFTIQSGTVTAPSSTLLIGATTTGNYTNWGIFNNNNGTVQMNGTAASSMIGNMTGANRFNILNFTNTGTYTFGAYPAEVYGAYSQSGTGSVTAPSTTFTFWNNFSKTGSGNFIPTSTGTVNMNAGATAAMTITTSGGMNTSPNTTGSCFNNLIFNGITGTTSWSLSTANSLLVANNFVNNGGTITAPGSGLNLSINGSYTNNGVFANNTGNVVMQGTQTTLSMNGNMTSGTNGAFYNLTFSGAGAWTCNNNMEVANILTQSAGTLNAPAILTIDNSAAQTSTFNHSAGTFNAPSSYFYDGGAFNNTGGIFYPNGGTVVMNATTPPTTSYAMTTTNMTTIPTNCFNNLTFNGGAGVLWSMASSDSAYVNGNFVIMTGTVIPTTTLLNINGNYQNNGVFTAGTNTVNMGGTVGGLTMSGNMTAATFSNFYNLTFNGVGGAWTFGSNAADVLGNFNITNGSVTAPSTLLQVAGNWTNGGTYFNNTGSVNLIGATTQTLTGSTTFNNLTLNNSLGAIIANDQTVNGTLTLANGVITIGANNLILGPLAPFIGGTFSSTAMISASGTGQIRKQMVTNGNFFFPMGDAGGNYTPFAMNFTAPAYGGGAYVGVNETATKHPNNANVNNYLKRYWSVRTNAITSPSYTVTQATYVPGDVVGTESLMSMGQYPLALPWLKYGSTNAATHTLASGTVTTLNGDFSGITTAPPTVGSSPNTAICFGQSTIINTIAPTGDPSLSYAWAPANSLNASFGTSVVATPTVTTTYTVTITDGNGFTNTSTTTVVVNPLPTPIAGTTTQCTGLTYALTSSPAGGVWTSGNTFWATINSSNGVDTAVAAGNPVITYTLPTGCLATTTLTINTSPLNITGIASVCAGLTTNLFDATPGGNWSSSNTAAGTISTTGTVSGIAAGVTNVSYTMPVTGCYAATPVTVNALPIVHNITGGGSYCSGGAGLHIGLNGSQTGVNYQLFNNALLVSTMPGTGATLDFGRYTAASTNYTIVATNGATGCTSNMNGMDTITILPLPTVYSLAGGGAFCSGGSGITLTLSGSQYGYNYQLYNYGVASGTSITGTSFAMPIGPLTTAGVYTIGAVNPATGCSNAMSGSDTIIVNPLPVVYNMTGGGNYCIGGSGVRVGLSFSDPGVNYQLYYNGVPMLGRVIAGSSAPIDFGLQTSVGNYTVVATNGTTGCSSNMTGVSVVGLNSLPNTYPIATAGGSYCAGGAGIDIKLSFADAGISYQLYNGSTPAGMPMLGSGTYLDFGNQTAAGTYTIYGTNTITGCVSEMGGAAVISINPLPLVYNVGGTGNYCSGTTGVDITLSNSQTGVNYSLYRAGTMAAITSMPGNGHALNFGPQTIAGIYTVVANNTTTGCTSNMAGSATVTVNPLPVVYNVTGGGAYCIGAGGKHIGLSNSDLGISYQLYGASGAVGLPVPGANASIDFGLITVAGTYSVVATNNVTGCIKNMSGNPSIIVNTNPAVFTVASGASSYCAGGTGVDFTLSGSESGVKYQLMNGGSAVGAWVNGDNLAINFGMHTGAGAYTAVAVNTVTGCTSNMAASPVIYVNPLPTAYAVSGGGSYCSGGSGVAVGLSNSDTGVSYQLYDASGHMAGSAVAGSGGAISFGMLTTAGVYKVIATNVSTTCVGNMVDSARVNVVSLPLVYTVTGGGPYCSGGNGSAVGLSGSDLGVNYQLYVGGVPTGSVVAGTGRALNFGLQTTTGIYTVVGTNAATPCNMNMASSVTISINPLPGLYTVVGGGGYCAGTSGVRDSLSGSDLGVNYQLFRGTVAVGSPMTGTGNVIDFGLQTTPGVYKVIATDAITNCSVPMIYTDSVYINPLPVVYSVTGGGNYCSGTSGVRVGLLTGDIGVNYQLIFSGLVDTTVAGGGVALDFGLQTAAGVYTAVGINGSTGCRSNMTGSATVGINASVLPSVTISSNKGDTVCSGTNVTYTALAGNGGTSPVYSWSINGTFVSAASGFNYNPVNGDVVAVTLTSDAQCAMPLNVSNSMTMAVITSVMPSAMITATPGDTVCRGTSVTFRATTRNGGSAPTYTWYDNGVYVGTGLSYTAVPDNNDVIIFMLNSDMSCRLTDTVFSNDVIMIVDTVMPSLSIISNSPIFGHMDTLVAVAHNAGTSPTYKWYVNGHLQVGQTKSTLISNQFITGDSVSCIVTTGSGSCAGTTAFNSVIISILSNVGVKTVTTGGSNINISPNPNGGTFTLRGSIGSSVDETVAVEVTDMIGQVVYRDNIVAKKGMINSTISLNKSLDNGMYIINLRSGNDNTVLHMVLEQ